ncbi:MAG: hypothetical protein WBV82_06350 [Myxococcaceae bacterium]
MVRRTWSRVAGWAVAIGLTTAASVGIVVTSWHTGPSSEVDGPTLERTRGTLQRIDARARMLTIESENALLDVRLDDATTIFVEGRSVGMGELRIGDKVCATWEPGPVPTAQWVEPCAD